MRQRDLGELGKVLASLMGPAWRGDGAQLRAVEKSHREGRGILSERGTRFPAKTMAGMVVRAPLGWGSLWSDTDSSRAESWRRKTSGHAPDPSVV